MDQKLSARPAARRLYLWLLAVALFAALSPAAQAQQSFVANCNPRHNRADFDGDCKTDISVFNRGTRDWISLNSSNGGYVSVKFGQSGDIIAPGDYDGGGKTDRAVFRPGTPAQWWVLRSSDGAHYVVRWGVSGDIPVARDYDGDNRTDVAVFRPSDATWYIRRSSGWEG
jgi:hypothetical protein